jgi:hypothetical protein
MARRTLTVVLATLATSVLAACAEPSTAPQRSQLAPAGASARDVTGPSSCRGGYTYSEGRC